MWVAETDPRSQSGFWQRFRESPRKQRERGRRREEKRKGQTEEQNGEENEGNKKRDNERKEQRDEIKMCQRKTAVNKTFCINLTHLMLMFESVIFLQHFFNAALFVCTLLSVCSNASVWLKDTALVFFNHNKEPAHGQHVLASVCVCVWL